MTATPEGVAYLVEGVTLSPMTSSVSFSGESLDHVGRTTTAPLRRSLAVGVVLEALAGDGRLLFSERIRFLRLPLLSSSTSSRSRWSSVGGSLLLYYASGCFAAVLLWRMLCRRRRW